MATEGPNQATAVVEFDDGWVPWVNVANAITFDQNYATALLVQTFTNFLDYTGFNFATVGDATAVTNVRVEVACKSSTLSGSPVLASVQLIVGGVVVGDAKTVSVPLLTSESWVDCGNASVAADFSTTLNGAQAKASGFGARVQFYDDDTATMSADACRITLTFAGSTPPVADFTGTPLSGTASLSVVFTDASTNTPTSWLWEKNSGSGWVNFAGTPTAQNPTESFVAGTWSVRVTATNAGGGDTKTRTNYVTATALPVTVTTRNDGKSF